MRSLSKHWIVPRFNQRDSTATSWIYEHFFPDVFLIVKKLTRDSPDAEDLAADTFLRLFQHARPFENIYKIRFFLYTAARNISLDYLRHQQVITNKLADVKEYYLSLEEAAVEEAEQRAAFHHLYQLAIEKLPPQCKQVFLLCFTEQLKNAQIARRLGISEKTVANLKLYAYKKLRMEIGPPPGSAAQALLGMLLL